jgi:hypothetical protein
MRVGTEYRDWQQRLADAFFLETSGAVVLFVDDDELQRLAGGDPNAAMSLSRAVADLIRPSAGQDLFWELRLAERQWKAGPMTEPPPTLPLLAITVLAASQMRHDTKAAAHNYYIRLAEVLLPGKPADEVSELRNTLRGGGFLDVAQMWVTLDEWISQGDGSRGVSTIADHPGRLTRIGYPLSQALVRRSDRAALMRFFAAMDMKDAGVPATEPLMRWLKLWTSSRPRGLSDTFLRNLGDDETAPMLAEIVHRLALSWDGLLMTAEGLRRVEVRLSLDLDRWRKWWVLAAADQVDHDRLSGTIGSARCELEITLDAYSHLYCVTGVPPVETAAVLHGFCLTGSKAQAEFSGTRLLVLTGDPDAGAWLSRDSVALYEEHILAAHTELIGDVERALQKGADPGWRLQPQQPDRALLPGFAIFTRVTFSDQHLLSEALNQLPGLVGASIRPESTARPRLANGLRIARSVASACYMRGGEPDLLLPVGNSPRHVSASLDGAAQERPFKATGFPIPLRRIGPLEEGVHDLICDDAHLRFSIAASAPGEESPSGAGTLGWGTDGHLTDEPKPMVCGAEVVDDWPPEPVLANRGEDETWLIHRNGHLSPLDEPAPSALLADLIVGVSSYYFEVAPPPTAGWLVQKRGLQFKIVRIRELAPEFRLLDSESQRMWRALENETVAGDILWKQYVENWQQQHVQ